MANQTTNYQCPACTGPLNFSPKTGKVACEYCGSSYELAEIEALYAEKDKEAAEAQAEAEQEESSWDTSELTDDWGEDAEGMRTYSCPSCMAQLMCDDTTAATSCPYCGNPTIVPGQFTGALKPDCVIGFALDKKAAVEALKKHYEKRFFLPRSFKDSNHIEKIQGVYVPFWLFDGVAEGSARFQATRSRRYRRGEYQITETSHFAVSRSGSIAFEKVPVDASSKMPDDYMDSIEPYDYSKLQPFSTAFLPGFLADRYDVTIDESKKRADERCAGTLYDQLRSTVVGYETVVPAGSSIRVRGGKVHYALLPVWLLNTKWEGKDFLFAMNGQTGKMVGDLPVNWKKFWGVFFGIGAALSAIASAVLLLM